MNNTMFTEEQMNQIEYGKMELLDVSKYANPELTPNQMRLLLLTFDQEIERYNAMTEEDIKEDNIPIVLLERDFTIYVNALLDTINNSITIYDEWVPYDDVVNSIEDSVVNRRYYPSIM